MIVLLNLCNALARISPSTHDRRDTNNIFPYLNALSLFFSTKENIVLEVNHIFYFTVSPRRAAPPGRVRHPSSVRHTNRQIVRTVAFERFRAALGRQSVFQGRFALTAFDNMDLQMSDSTPEISVAAQLCRLFLRRKESLATKSWCRRLTAAATRRPTYECCETCSRRSGHIRFRSWRRNSN